MGFWKGAIGTKKQKIFWVVFSIIVAIVALVIMFFLLPIRVVQTVTLKGGEWAHFYPDSFWHTSASYSFSTVPRESTGTGKDIDSAVAHLYDISLHGIYVDYENIADGLDFVIGKSQMSTVRPNWNATISVTDGTHLSVTLDEYPVLSAPVDFIITSSSESFDLWLEDKMSSIPKRTIIKSVEKASKLSESVDIASPFKYIATQRVTLGIKVSKENEGTLDVIRGNFYHSVAKANLGNCTNFTGKSVDLEFKVRQLLQIDAPEECTNGENDHCLLSVVIEPRWGLYFGVVVLPVVVVSVLFVIGMMAVKAFHVRQMIAQMRKKATEEGVALEEGKSKDIHQERLDEANAEGDMSDPHNSTEEPRDEDNDQPKEEASGAAVLTSGPDGEN